MSSIVPLSQSLEEWGVAQHNTLTRCTNNHLKFL
jgi:hypothetical protein